VNGRKDNREDNREDNRKENRFNPVQLLIIPNNNIAKIQILLILKYQNTPYLKYIFQNGF
jgi:hypothetical protein